MTPYQSRIIQFLGGVDGVSPETQIPEGRLRIGINVEAKPNGGIRRLLGYTGIDSEVPGQGPILGVWVYDGRIYALRDAPGGLTAAMYSTAGTGGWRLDKSGLTPAGRYRFINHAFAGTQKMYGVSGTHQAFEWDGTTWTDIATGYPDDRPSEIVEYRQHLFLSFRNSVQHSSPGDPLTWSAVLGAGELLQPDTVTGFSTMPNGALGIFTRSSITVLAGSSSADWIASNMRRYGNNAGAIPGTMQPMGAAVRFCDSRGVLDLAASDTSSDLRDALLSLDMDEVYRARWKDAVCSTVVREKDQYRLFFPNKTGLILTFSGNYVMPTQLQFAHAVLCTVNAEDENGNEVIYFGSDNGWVYQMESGRTFGGANIDAYAESAFSDMRVTNAVKRFHRVRFDVKLGGASSSLTAVPRLLVDEGDIVTSAREEVRYATADTPLGQGVLGQLLLGSAPIGEGQIEIRGIAHWLSVRFGSSTSNEEPWEVDGMTVDYKVGRRRR